MHIVLLTISCEVVIEIDHQKSMDTFREIIPDVRELGYCFRWNAPFLTSSLMTLLLSKSISWREQTADRFNLTCCRKPGRLFLLSRIVSFWLNSVAVQDDKCYIICFWHKRSFLSRDKNLIFNDRFSREGEWYQIHSIAKRRNQGKAWLINFISFYLIPLFVVIFERWFWGYIAAIDGRRCGWEPSSRCCCSVSM
jgi:hypothetical protein